MPMHRVYVERINIKFFVFDISSVSICSCNVLVVITKTDCLLGYVCQTVNLNLTISSNGKRQRYWYKKNIQIDQVPTEIYTQYIITSYDTFKVTCANPVFRYYFLLFFFLNFLSLCSCIFLVQERIKAEAENRPLPPLHGSGDVRALSMADFKFAHEQVLTLYHY